MGTRTEDVIRLVDMTESIREIEGYISPSTNYNDLSQLENARDAIMAELAQIGGAAALLTDEFKDEHNEIDWDVLKGLQYSAANDALELDLHTIFYLVKEDLPYIHNQLIDLITRLQDDEDLDENTLNAEDKQDVHNRYVEEEDVMDPEDKDIRYEDNTPPDNRKPVKKDTGPDERWIETTEKKRKGPFHP
jgi:uncharacterized protein with HEPN domain